MLMCCGCSACHALRLGKRVGGAPGRCGTMRVVECQNFSHLFVFGMPAGRCNPGSFRAAMEEPSIILYPSLARPLALAGCAVRVASCWIICLKGLNTECYVGTVAHDVAYKA